MSQSFHQGIFGFSDAFDRQPRPDHQHQQQQATVYEPAAANNMLSEMFNFTPSGISAADLLANQIASAYRLHRPPSPGAASGFGGDWTYAAAAHHRNNSTTLHQVAHHMTGSPLVDKQNHHQAAMPGLNADSAAAMQLFLVDPQGQVQQQPRSPSPPSPVPRGIPLVHQDLLAATSSVGGGAEGRQGLSLSLSSPLQRQLEMEKAEEMRGRGGLLYYNNNHNPLQSQEEGQGLGGGMGMVNVLRHSKYSRAAQEVLAEFCNVGGRGLQLKDGRGGRAKRQATSNPNISTSQGGEGASSSCSSKDRPPVLSPSDRSEQQRRKAKLFSLVDKVDERYGRYREQMQKVVDSFDTAMGLGAATPYTGLAQKAMSCHFRSLKDAIAAQLKRACELLGENYGIADAGVPGPGSGSGSGSGLTKGETPRLRILDRSLRRHRSFHYDRMEQEAWRPQRGLPERSVNMLRAWLFEHFLHPYPSDADKHLLARQTGLTRNQVSNWFINARVRLWKPMIEEMYLQEAEGEKGDQTSQAQQQPQAHEIPQCGTSILSTAAETKSAIRSDDQLITPSMLKQQQPLIPFPASSDNNTNHLSTGVSGNVVGTMAAASGMGRLGTAVHVGGGVMVGSHFGAGLVGFGAPGDVSLTLGLRHAPDNGGSGRYFNGR